MEDKKLNLVEVNDEINDESTARAVSLETLLNGEPAKAQPVMLNNSRYRGVYMATLTKFGGGEPVHCILIEHGGKLQIAFSYDMAYTSHIWPATIENKVIGNMLTRLIRTALA